MTWINAHRESERLASEAEAARRRGESARAATLYKAAANSEVRALQLVAPDKPKTLGITAVSAASLQFKADDFAAAEELAFSYLAKRETPDFAKEELRAVVQSIWNERQFRLSGVKFVRGELLVSVAGGLVAVGAAPLELVHRKVDEVKNLYFRTVEMLLGLPLRRKGPPSQDVRDKFRPWILQAPAGSYQFAIRVEKPGQRELFEAESPRTENVTDVLLQIVQAASTGAIDSLDATVAPTDYKECFIKQTRNLAPTGKSFNQLTIKSTGHPDLSPIVLSPESRKVLGEFVRPKSERHGMAQEQERIVGILRGLQLDKDWIEVTDAATGETYRIHQAGEVIDDLVGPMVNHKVLVDVYRHNDGKRVFRDIQSEE